MVFEVKTTYFIAKIVCACCFDMMGDVCSTMCLQRQVHQALVVLPLYDTDWPRCVLFHCQGKVMCSRDLQVWREREEARVRERGAVVLR